MARELIRPVRRTGEKPVRSVSSEAIHQVVYSNALKVYGSNTEMKEEHWLAPSGC
jgi:hypothetical protein